MTEQRRRPIVPLVAVALFVLTAGTFGTLWLLERAEHSTVSEQLTAVEAESNDVKAKLAVAQEKQDGLDKRNVEVSNAKRTAETAAYNNRDCAKATREMHIAGAAGNVAEYQTKWEYAYYYCETDR
ncbi:hypothetical protein LWC34_22570 [Kibdelosporangium philippinense]|uniref:Uncharacterized protein n=1 Tax=Kibdelosporangium philippinense TaxID=211113 RepID=A0ABS8ZCK2_9PSEU|nr:hypothetical protein [Kibdelosporangium philippinense]MCE7005588.1 hypothetical protein [Kibdelosporangium philippinense]